MSSIIYILNCISIHAILTALNMGKYSVSTGLIGTSLFRAVSFFSTPVLVPLNVCGYTVKRKRRKKQVETGPAQIPLFKKSFGGGLWSGRVYGFLLHKNT